MYHGTDEEIKLAADNFTAAHAVLARAIGLSKAAQAHSLLKAIRDMKSEYINEMNENESWWQHQDSNVEWIHQEVTRNG